MALFDDSLSTGMLTELAAGVVLNCGICVMCDGGGSCLSTT